MAMRNRIDAGLLMVSVMIHDRMIINGALASRRILIIYACCTLVMSVVIRVTSPEVEKWSIFLKEKSCTL